MATQDEIKFLNSPKIGINKKILPISKSGMGTLTTKILNFC